MINIILAGIFLGLFLVAFLTQIGRFVYAVYHKQSFRIIYFYIPAFFLTLFYIFSRL